MIFQHLFKGINCQLSLRNKKIALTIGGQQLTYGELATQAHQLSQWIANQLKADNSRQYRIAVVLDRDEQLLPCILAVIMSGHIYIPIDPITPTDRVKYIVNDSHADLILTTPAKAEKLRKRLEETPIVTVNDTLQTECTAFVQSRNCQDNDIAYIIYTSGTTGTPKGVPITYANLYALIQNINETEDLRITSESRLLQFVSISFDPSVLTIINALYHGSQLIMATQEERKDVGKLISLIQREQVTYASLPAAVISIFPTFDLPSLQTLASGGESLPAEVIDKAMGHSFKLINVYGPTENTVISTYKCYTTDSKNTNIGQPLPGIVSYVVDEQMNPVKTGEKGELLLGGKQLFAGYINKQEATAAALISNPFEQTKEDAPQLYRTGDLVVQLPNGDYDFAGRKDMQVKLWGYRIELDGIKQHIEQCDGVKQAYVRVEKIGNQKHIVAYVTTAEGKDVQTIKKNAREFLPPYMMPSFFVPIDHFHLTVNGKIDESFLHNTELDRLTQNTKSTNETEVEITRILCNIMQLDNINADIDLIDQLAMSSVQIMEAVSVMEFTGLHLTVKDFYSKRTISQLAKVHNDSQLCYWYETPQKGKPVVVVVSGYTSFVFLYTKWAELIKERYNIFVIESYHFYHKQEPLSFEEYTDLYLNMVTPVLEEYGIDTIMGLCLGGELGLYLAHRLHQLKGIKPHVVVIDGEVDRDTQRERVAPLVWKTLPHDINERRLKLDYKLIETQPNFTYEGPVTSVLAKNLPKGDVNDPNADTSVITDEHRYWMKQYFLRAPAYWRRHYPQCTIIYQDLDHYEIFKDYEKSIKPLADYFISLISTFQQHS